MIVAHDEREVHELEALQRRGTGNGVAGLEIVDRAFIVAREPAVNTRFALWSPDSGIVNAEEFVKALLRTGAEAGVIFLPGTKLIGADRHADGMVLATERESIIARVVVNASGLYADEVSRLLGGETFTIYPCRGEYAEFTPAKRALVNGLVYPLPHRSGHGLGVHLVRTTGGQVWLGPTIRYQDRKDDYENDREPLEAFAASARRADRRRVDRRSPAVGQRHPREAAPAVRIVCRLPDQKRPGEPGGRAGVRHRFAGTDLFACGRQSRARSGRRISCR